MSQENVEVVRRMIAAAERGDWTAALSCYDEAVELDQTRLPGAGVYHGREGVRRFYSRWFQTWDGFDMRTSQVIDAGELVVSVAEISGTGKTSGACVTMRSANVFTVRAGRIVRHVGYPDATEALEALGLDQPA